MAAHAKAIAVAVIGAAVTVLAAAGINVDPALAAAIVTVVTAVVVHAVPNAQ